MEWLSDPQAWVALATLTALEIVLGIDNIIFISILVSRLPEHQRQRARVIGLGLAMFTRILLLLSLAWVMGLTDPLFTVFGEEISGRGIILVGGGRFLPAECAVDCRIECAKAYGRELIDLHYDDRDVMVCVWV